jgi:hypothetical protein
MLPEPGGANGLPAKVVHPASDRFLAGLGQLVAEELLKAPHRGDVVLEGAVGAISHPEVAGEPGQGYTDCHCSSP